MMKCWRIYADVLVSASAAELFIEVDPAASQPRQRTARQIYSPFNGY